MDEYIARCLARNQRANEDALTSIVERERASLPTPEMYRAYFERASSRNQEVLNRLR